MTSRTVTPPAPYAQTGPGAGDYGNHYLANRPTSPSITNIVVHTEGSYATTGLDRPDLRLVAVHAPIERRAPRPAPRPEGHVSHVSPPPAPGPDASSPLIRGIGRRAQGGARRRAGLRPRLSGDGRLPAGVPDQGSRRCSTRLPRGSATRLVTSPSRRTTTVPSPSHRHPGGSCPRRRPGPPLPDQPRQPVRLRPRRGRRRRAVDVAAHPTSHAASSPPGGRGLSGYGQSGQPAPARGCGLALAPALRHARAALPALDLAGPSSWTVGRTGRRRRARRAARISSE